MKVLVVGACGKMGQMLCARLNELKIENCGIDKHNRTLADDFDADVVVDFSSSECLKENLILAKQKRIPIVIATTNHSAQNLQLIDEFKRDIPIFMSANFSIMFNVMLKLMSNLGALKNCDFVLTEIHHKHKKDSPSGSCLKIKTALNKQGIQPTITAHRVGEVVGEHMLQIFGESESLTISHSAQSRRVFCDGAILACKFIENKSPALYGMSDLLNLD